MAVTNNQADGIVVLSAAADTITFPLAEYVEQIMLRGTAAGAFVVVLGRASITIDNSASGLTVVIPVNRRLKTITLTSGPAGAQLTAFLGKK